MVQSDLQGSGCKSRALGGIGISIVVAAGSLRRDVVEVPFLARICPESRGARRRRSPGADRSSDGAGAVDQPLRPGAGDEIAVAAPGANGKSASQGPRTAFVLRVGTIDSSDPASRRAILWGERDEGAEGVPGKRGGRPGGDPFLRRAGQGVAHPGRRTRNVGNPPRGQQNARSIPPPVAGLRSAAPAAPPAAGTSSPLAGNIRVERLGDNRFSIDEAGVTQLTTNINQYMTQVRLIPFFEGDKSAGYRIAAIRPGTTFEQLGFQGGDVLQQVDGWTFPPPRSSTPSSRT